MPPPPSSFGQILRMLAVALLVVLVGVAVGLAVYWFNDSGQPEQISSGETGVADRVTVFATVEKVDPAQYTAGVRIVAVPRGGLTSDDGETADRDIQVRSDGLGGGQVLLARGRRIAAQSMPVELHRGEITHYPFDRYSADLYFSAVVDGSTVPVEVVVENNDAFFTMSGSAAGDSVEPGVHLGFGRSGSTFIMVTLMFVVMWALALAVAAAAIVIGRRRLGLVWPAMGWMAATLFALAAFRGTAPGTPPIGTILDYTAFLWAEAIVACALTYVVARGVLLDRLEPNPP